MHPNYNHDDDGEHKSLRACLLRIEPAININKPSNIAYDKLYVTTLKALKTRISLYYIYIPLPKIQPVPKTIDI